MHFCNAVIYFYYSLAILWHFYKMSHSQLFLKVLELFVHMQTV